MDYSKILEKIKLSREQENKLKEKINKTISKINNEFENQSIKAEVVLGGSAAKSTMLKGDFDVDLFARLDYKYKVEKISVLVKKVLEKLFSIQSLQGSREYFQFNQDNLTYEVVPVLKIENYSQACNVTDASPLHVDWVRKATNKNPDLINQIILAKSFLKANRLYGAESYIGGFSGHIVDILVIYYGGFESLLKAAVNWQQGMRIDPENHGKKLNKAKLGPLVIIDPVQPQRNAAAALGLKKYRKFKKIAKQFLENPSKEFFKKKKITIEKLKQKADNNKLIVLKVEPLKGKDDIVGAKIMKSFQHIKKKLKEFKIINSGWEWDKKQPALCWYILGQDKLPKQKEHRGPPVSSKNHAKMFRQANENVYVKNNILYAKVNREFTDPKKLVKQLINTEYIKQRVKKVLLL
ncbi:MAG: CCA-adding enzyme [Candidatus Woesearchaeota archaeon]|nr:CCA-adding enzyme [Candidatus Woesearchaeota archaeon]